MSDTVKKSYYPELDHSLCKACGYCAMVCPKKMFRHSGKVNSQGYDYMESTESGECIGCLQCINVCPDFVITIKEK